jgi:transposase
MNRILGGPEMKHKRIVGVDVSKEWLDISFADPPHRAERLLNQHEAIAAWLERARPGLVAFEPTGGYERLLKACLRERGILFVRVHPNDVIAFRRSRGIKAKTDRIDAQLIATFAADELCRRGLRPDRPGNELLRELVARRRQVSDALHAERCRLALAAADAVRSSLLVVIGALQQSLETLNSEIGTAIAADPEIRAVSELLQTVQGIGPMVAALLIADLPELGHLSVKEIAALVGLAPHTRQSGKTRSRERTTHRRPDARRALFNAARAAIRHPSPFKEFYERLITRNQRPGRVALTAVMRKILVAANAIARDKQPWRLQAA